MRRFLSFLAALLLAGPTVCRAHGSLDEMIAAASTAIAQSPQQAALYLRRAELLRLHADWTAAEADYARASALQPSLSGAKLGLAELRCAQGRDAEALALLNDLLRRTPAIAEGLVLSAGLLEKRGDWRLADADLAAACAASVECHYTTRRAELLERHGETDTALRCLDETSRARGRVPVLEHQALAIAERAGRTDAALQRVEALIAVEPRRDIWLARKAAILAKAGRQADAHAAWTDAAQALQALPAERLALESNRRLSAQIEAGLAVTSRPDPPLSTP